MGQQFRSGSAAVMLAIELVAFLGPNVLGIIAIRYTESFQVLLYGLVHQPVHRLASGKIDVNQLTVLLLRKAPRQRNAALDKYVRRLQRRNLLVVLE